MRLRLIPLLLSLLSSIAFAAAVLATGQPAPAREGRGPTPPLHLPILAKNQQPVYFPHGIASGDVTSSTAVLWTRADHEALLTLQVSTDQSFVPADTYPSLLAASGSDFTTKLRVGSLIPGETYYYRWTSGGTVSPTGIFHTPPDSATPSDVRFVYSGDTDGTRIAGIPFWNSFEALDAARQEDPVFFVYLGDTIYSDSGGRPGGPAVTLDEYRDTYKENRGYPALSGLLASSSSSIIWDDHEVVNDFAGQTVDPARYQAGRQAFLEYMPIDESALPADPDCAGDPLFRVFHWGAAADLVVLDERSCRSSKAESACTLLGFLDPAPTAPADVRSDFGLPASPPPGCLAAITDPARTILGDVQKQLLKDFLLNSTAKFKFVINQVPIQQLYVFPYDRWEGYAAEREEILDFIRDNSIENVVFLSTDLHANLINEVYIDYTADPETIAYEFVTGPVAARRLQAALEASIGTSGVAAVQQALTDLGMNCRHLDAYSYGLVEVDASAGTATITLKDDAGTMLADQVFQNVDCKLTLGP